MPHPHSRSTRILIAVVIFGGLTFAQNEGDKPYIPTRLEWLALQLNARLRIDLFEHRDFSLDFAPLNADTILIYVRYLPSVDREAMNSTIDTARKVISIDAKSHGWSSWLKVKEDVGMVEKH